MKAWEYDGRRLNRLTRLLTLTVAAILAVLVFAVLWVGIRGAIAYQHLARIESASADISNIFDEPSSATPVIARLASDAQQAHDLTSDPIWLVAGSLPWIGPQVSALSTTAASADALIRESLLPISTAAADVSVDDLRPEGGHIDPRALEPIRQSAVAAAPIALGAAESLRMFDRTPLLRPIDSAVGHAESAFTEVATAIDGVARTAELLPDLLGGNGARNYLLLVQNNAEWRSLGGIAGIGLLLHVEDGHITLGSSISATEISASVTSPIGGTSEELAAIYGMQPERFFHNVTEIPDFSTAGQLAKRMYALHTGLDVDGVFAADPVALSYLLKATGPVDLPNGDRLDSSNAVSVLLNEVYERYEKPEQQDAYFGATTSAVFSEVLNGRGSTADILTAVVRAGVEHRLLAWMANPSEQSVIANSTLAGALPISDARVARLGVYLNDGTGSKMSYYVDPTVTVTWDQCGSIQESGPRALTVRIQLANYAPLDAATSLPRYITGGGAYGVSPGTARVVSNVVLPPGFEIVTVASSDGMNSSQARLAGRTVETFGTDLPPGATTTLTVTARGNGSATEAEVYATPTADAGRSPVIRSSCSAAPNLGGKLS